MQRLVINEMAAHSVISSNNLLQKHLISVVRNEKCD